MFFDILQRNILLGPTMKHEVIAEDDHVNIRSACDCSQNIYQIGQLVIQQDSGRLLD
jgi:hypothetical protein